MVKIYLTHHKVCITKVTYRKACPYCKKKPLLKKTCGSPACQHKHHVVTLRKRKRKTEQVRNSVRLKLNLPR